jgi:rhodanese-related sulfurtransferase
MKKLGLALLASVALATASFASGFNPWTPVKAEIKAAYKFVKTITPQELKKWIDEDREFTIFDVREPDEVTAMQIDWVDTDVMPRGKFEFIMASKLEANPKAYDRKNGVFVVVCKKGSRSALVGEKMVKLFGFKNVYVLKGGIWGWLDAGYSVMDNAYHKKLKLAK